MESTQLTWRNCGVVGVGTTCVRASLQARRTLPQGQLLNRVLLLCCVSSLLASSLGNYDRFVVFAAPNRLRHVCTCPLWVQL